MTRGFFNQGFADLAKSNNDLKDQFGTLLQSQQSLNSSVERLTHSIGGMAASILDTLNAQRPPLPQNSGVRSGTASTRHQSQNGSHRSTVNSENTAGQQSQSSQHRNTVESENIWAQSVPSPPDRTPKHRDPFIVQQQVCSTFLTV